MKQKGKKLEKEVKEYLKNKDIPYHQFRDSYQARGFVQPVPSDFIIFKQDVPTALMVECKETKKAKMPLTNFQPSQFKAMKQSIGNRSVIYYAIIKHNSKYILVYCNDILECLYKNEKKLDLTGYAEFKGLEDAMEFMFRECIEKSPFINETIGLYI